MDIETSDGIVAAEPAQLSQGELIAQAVAAYLLRRPYKIRITGTSKSVQEFTKALEDLKTAFDKMVLEEDILKEGGVAKTLVAGIIGYLLGRGTGLRLTGTKKEVNKVVGALDKIKSAIDRASYSTQQSPRW